MYFLTSKLDSGSYPVPLSVTITIMSEFPNLEKKLKEQLSRLGQEFVKIRGDRAHANVVEDIIVDHYGAKQPIKALSTIGMLGPQVLIVEPWDKDALEAIANAITKSQNGLTAVVDGDRVRVPFPPLSKERRDEFVKFAAEKAEEAQIRLRRTRDEERKELIEQERKKEVSKDDFFRAKEKLDKLFKEYSDKIDELKTVKEKELSTI